MARTSTETAQMFQNAYDKSKDFIGTIKHESRAVYEDTRRWLPEHSTVVAMSASAAVCVGAFGYVLGRRTRAAANRRTVSAAIARAPELDLAPVFRFLKLWMMYRIATKD